MWSRWQKQQKGTGADVQQLLQFSLQASYPGALCAFDTVIDIEAGVLGKQNLAKHFGYFSNIKRLGTRLSRCWKPVIPLNQSTLARLVSWESPITLKRRNDKIG